MTEFRVEARRTVTDEQERRRRFARVWAILERQPAQPAGADLSPRPAQPAHEQVEADKQ